jgi:hypothetical protein
LHKPGIKANRNFDIFVKISTNYRDIFDKIFYIMEETEAESEMELIGDGRIAIFVACGDGTDGYAVCKH